MHLLVQRSNTGAQPELLKAQAGAVRVRVLALPAERDQSIDELAAPTADTAATLRHAKALRHGEIIDSRRLKKTLICASCDPPAAELLAMSGRLISNNPRHRPARLAALHSVDDVRSLAEPAGNPT